MKSMNREEIKNLESKLNEVEGRSDKFEKLIVKKLDEMAQFQKLTQPQTQDQTFIIPIDLCVEALGLKFGKGPKVF